METVQTVDNFDGSAVVFSVCDKLSDIEELMAERGVKVDHSTVNRWVIEYAPQLENEFRKNSWRADEAYVKIKGQWNYLYRAVDKEGNAVDFHLSKNRYKSAAEAFLSKAIGGNMLPEK